MRKTITAQACALTNEQVLSIISENKAGTREIKLDMTKIKKYLPDQCTEDEIVELVYKALELLNSMMTNR